jgi:hypothetical protein
MSTDKQIVANRLNAQKSTGPKTPEGRAAVRLNGVKHGLYAETLVLPGERESDFTALLESYEAEHQPATPTEEALVARTLSPRSAAGKPASSAPSTAPLRAPASPCEAPKPNWLWIRNRPQHTPRNPKSTPYRPPPIHPTSQFRPPTPPPARKQASTWYRRPTI